MPYGIAIVLDLLVMMHVYKTNRPHYWMYIVLMVPVLGCIAYLLCEVIPSYARSYSGRALKSKIIKKVAPERDTKILQRRIEARPSIKSVQDLAIHFEEDGKYELVLELIAPLLRGLYEFDPNLLLLKANAEFKLGQFNECLQTLASIKKHDPYFRSIKADQLYKFLLDEKLKNK